MRIALLNDLTEVRRPGGGGAESHLATLWDGLMERGHEVLLTADWPRAVEWAEVVHVHNLADLRCLPRCRELGRPAVVSLHDYWPVCPSRMGMREDRNCYQDGCRYQCGASRPAWYGEVSCWPCVTFSTRAAAIFAQQGLTARVIPHGLDLDFWYPAYSTPRVPPVRVACVTAWGSALWKGMHLARLLEARLGSRAHFWYILGGYTREQVRELYWWADVVLVPSLYEETFCLVAAEAEACGRPVVGFALGGLLELASTTVPAGDFDAAGQALLHWQTLEVRSPRSHRDMVADYEQLYWEVLRGQQ